MHLQKIVMNNIVNGILNDRSRSGVGTCSINNTVGDDTLPIHSFYNLKEILLINAELMMIIQNLYMNQCLQINNMNNPTFNSDTVLFHDSEKYDFKFNDFVYEKDFL